MSGELNEDKVPLPWNPNEQCELDKKLVQNKKDAAEEQDGTLFTRECDDLDSTIVKRKDRFIDCVDIPDVPKAKLLKEDWPIVSFPGVPDVEIPKRLMAHLLSCCLKDRTAGFGFDITQELDGNSKAQISNWADENNPITTTVAIQLGTTGYLLIGLNLKPQLCFCDESCGDEDYIHITANLDAVYHDEIDDHIHEDPDLVITDEQLTKLVSEHGGGGGGGGNPLCSRKMFAVYQGGNSFIPYNGVSEIVDAPVFAELAPYLSNTTLVQNAIYKLEYFCEYDSWYVTDGACGTLVPTYTGTADRVTSAEGAKNSQWEGYFILDSSHASDLAYELATNESTTTPSAAFVNGISFTIPPGPDNNPRHAIRYQFTLKEGASGALVYYASVVDAISCRPTYYRLIIKVKEIPLDEDEEQTEEEQTNENE